MFVEEKPLTLPALEPSPTQPQTVGEVLLAAARFIEEHGWSATGHKYHNNGPVCPIEAINRVTEGRRLAYEAIEAIDKYTWRKLNMGIIRWNASSNEDEVVATMRAVAKFGEITKC